MPPCDESPDSPDNGCHASAYRCASPERVGFLFLLNAIDTLDEATAPLAGLAEQAFADGLDVLPHFLTARARWRLRGWLFVVVD